VMERILYNIEETNHVTRTLRQLHKFVEEKNPKISEEVAIMAREVGHDVYIFAYRLGMHSPTIASALSSEKEAALTYYRVHTG